MWRQKFAAADQNSQQSHSVWARLKSAQTVISVRQSDATIRRSQEQWNNTCTSDQGNFSSSVWHLESSCMGFSNAACKTRTWLFTYVFWKCWTSKDFKTTVNFSKLLRWLLVLKKIVYGLSFDKCNVNNVATGDSLVNIRLLPPSTTTNIIFLRYSFICKLYDSINNFTESNMMKNNAMCKKMQHLNIRKVTHERCLGKTCKNENRLGFCTIFEWQALVKEHLPST